MRKASEAQRLAAWIIAGTLCLAKLVATPALMDWPATSALKKRCRQERKNDLVGNLPSEVSHKGDAMGWIWLWEAMYLEKMLQGGDGQNGNLKWVFCFPQKSDQLYAQAEKIHTWSHANKQCFSGWLFSSPRVIFQQGKSFCPAVGAKRSLS